MNNLVFIENGRTVTDSLTVAEVFGKEHKHVLRDIRYLECSEEFIESNFGLIEYTDPRNRTQQKYIITQDGFSFLAMGYTGKEAAQFKEMYINEFKRMREELRNQVPVLDSNAAIAIALRQTADVMDKLPQIESKLETIGRKLETQITLDSGQQRRLQQAVSKKVCSIEPDKDERGELFRQLYKEIKDRWEVPSYKDVLRQDLQAVLNYVEAWRPVRRAG
ncbi:Rha family transcriptional regulator [Paenibacillus gallinarum]|uniref:Rha family transcriptional regulator n=1 Tax=Paenibacillus gallinarum TaxID=2762232 RepID=A0ABR8SW43_9BACL|nr:Rha family transcriptional regulator [Paenibacillus gallinarum]MBD7967713.1 Rha family transcriptional regulator [Paenibacillus gallinarum]